MKYLSKKIGYGLYDFANSGYVIIFQIFLLPLYITSSGTSIFDGNIIWSYALFFSNLFAVILSPIIGRYADLKNRIKIFTIVIVLVSVLSSFLIISSNIMFIVILFIFFNTIFEISQSLYDSLLNHVASNKKEKIEISTFAWGFGYVGGLIFILLYLILNKLSVSNEIVLLCSSILYLIFSLKSVSILTKLKLSQNNIVQKIRFKEIIKFRIPKNIKINLVIYFFVFLSLYTVIYYSSLYLKQELGLSSNIIAGGLLATQLLAFPLTILSGRFANRFGLVKTIKYSLWVWLIVLVGLALSQNIYHLIFVMIILSFVVGSTPSLLRAFYSSLIEDDKSSEFFGYFAMVNKAGSMLAPVVAIIGIYLTGELRYVFWIIAIILFLSIFLFNKIKQQE